MPHSWVVRCKLQQSPHTQSQTRVSLLLLLAVPFVLWPPAYRKHSVQGGQMSRGFPSFPACCSVRSLAAIFLAMPLMWCICIHANCHLGSAGSSCTAHAFFARHPAFASPARWSGNFRLGKTQDTDTRSSSRPWVACEASASKKACHGLPLGLPLGSGCVRLAGVPSAASERTMK